MIRHFYFSSILFFSIAAFGQKQDKSKYPPPPNHPATRAELKAEERNNECKRNMNLTFTSRLKKYPFNISTQIQFVSFRAGFMTAASDSGERYISNSLPRLNDTICYSKLVEIKAINFLQVDRLTDIFYNYGYRGNTNTISEASCYNPRNAILFLDSNGKVFEFIEICFECDKTRESSDKISLGDMCNQKTDMLKKLFKKVGIEYGITKGLMGED